MCIFYLSKNQKVTVLKGVMTSMDFCVTWLQNPYWYQVKAEKDGKVLFFENSSQAIKEGFHSSAIHKCCRGKVRTHKGYKWYYKEDYDNVSNNDIKLENSLYSLFSFSTI